MDQFKLLLLPAVLGLLAGIAHGITSHAQDLPFALTEQVLQSLPTKPSFD